MIIRLVKEKEEKPRMSTILNIIEKELKRKGYLLLKVDHIKGYIQLDTDRGAFLISSEMDNNKRGKEAL